MHTLLIYYDLMHEIEEMDALAEEIAGIQPFFRGGDGLSVRSLKFKFTTEAALVRAQERLLEDGRFRLFA